MSTTRSSRLSFLPMGLILVAAYSLSACQGTSSTDNAHASQTGSATDPEASDTTGVYRDVDVAEFQKLMTSLTQPIVLDVRTPEEWNEGHIAGAQLIDFNAPGFAESLAALPADRPLLIYCASGGRSGKTLERLRAEGGREVYNLRGGIGAWRNAGAPVDMNDPIQP